MSARTVFASAAVGPFAVVSRSLRYGERDEVIGTSTEVDRDGLLTVRYALALSSSLSERHGVPGEFWFEVRDAQGREVIRDRAPEPPRPTSNDDDLPF